MSFTDPGEMDPLAGLSSLLSMGGAAGLGVEWLGQSGVVLHFPEAGDVCIDPYLSHARSSGGTRPRLAPIPVAPWQVRVDLVVTTHDHVDHFDEHTLRPLAGAAPSTIFAGPASCREHWRAMEMPAERFLRLDRGESLDILDIGLIAVHAEHANAPDAIGVVVEADGYRAYHTGDTEYTPTLVEAVADMAPDVMFVPINGRLGNMDAADAAKLTGEVGPRIVVPVHFGMFPENTADPQTFIDACRVAGVEARVVVMTVGGRMTVTGDEG